MGGRGGVGDGAFGIAQVGSDRDQSCRIDQGPGGFPTAVEIERDNTAETTLLPFRQFVLRMRGQADLLDVPRASDAAQPLIEGICERLRTDSRRCDRNRVKPKR